MKKMAKDEERKNPVARESRQLTLMIFSFADFSRLSA